MRYRALDANGDYSGGRGQGNFLINSPACVAQSVLTRLKLWQGQWFLDLTEGTPWLQRILGKTSKQAADLAIRARVLATNGVTGIASYSSTLNTVTRALSVTMTIDTQFGQATITTIIVQPPPPPPVAGLTLNFTKPANVELFPAI
jgi:hypothetical protein